MRPLGRVFYLHMRKTTPQMGIRILSMGNLRIPM